MSRNWKKSHGKYLETGKVQNPLNTENVGSIQVIVGGGIVGSVTKSDAFVITKVVNLHGAIFTQIYSHFLIYPSNHFHNCNHSYDWSILII